MEGHFFQYIPSPVPANFPEGRVAIHNDQFRKVRPLKADIHIGDPHSKPLGRVSTQACVLSPSPEPDIISRLHDAKVNGMAQLCININGIEEVDGVLRAQS